MDYYKKKNIHYSSLKLAKIIKKNIEHYALTYNSEV